MVSGKAEPSDCFSACQKERSNRRSYHGKSHFLKAFRLLPPIPLSGLAVSIDPIYQNSHSCQENICIKKDILLRENFLDNPLICSIFDIGDF